MEEVAKGKQILVNSSNLKSIGYYEKKDNNGAVIGSIVIAFNRGGLYRYYPCTYDEFKEAFEVESLNSWFKKIKDNKSFVKIDG